MSNDGSTWAAATIDGAYAIWRRSGEQDIAQAQVVRQGRLSKIFPSSMSFSADVRFLTIGTGLGPVDNAIVVLDVQQGGQGEYVTETAAPVLNVEFTGMPYVILTGTTDGRTTIYRLGVADGRIQLQRQFDYAGITAFGVTPGGNAAVLKVEGQELPIVFPTGQLLDVQYDKSRFGIHVKQ
jgi:hypothetical protein